MDKFLVRKPNYDTYTRPDFNKIREKDRKRKVQHQIKLRECKRVVDLDRLLQVKTALEKFRKQNYQYLLDVARSLKAEDDEEREFGVEVEEVKDTQSALIILMRYLASLNMTYKILEETRIGKSLNSLAVKSKDSISEQVQQEAASILEKWRSVAGISQRERTEVCNENSNASLFQAQN